MFGCLQNPIYLLNQVHSFLNNMKNIIWKKIRFSFKVKEMVHWSVSHATCPTPVKLPNDDWRVFFSTRDDRNRSHVGWFDINLDNPLKILNVSEKPFLKPGPIGNFDGNGIYVSSAVEN